MATKAVKKCAKCAAPKKAAPAKVEKLAIDGGKKVWSKGFPAWPQFNPKTDKAVLDILHSGKVNYWTGQAAGEDPHFSIGMKFEREWAKWLGVKNAISVTNGTAALHVALASLGVGPGDEVCGHASWPPQGVSDTRPASSAWGM